MSFVEIGLLVLKIASALLGMAKERQQFNAGHEAAVLEQTRKVMELTTQGKAIWEKVDALSDDQLTDLESRLGGKS